MDVGGNPLLNWHRRIFTGVKNGDTHLNIVSSAAGEVLQGVALPQQYVNRFHIPHMLDIWSRMVVVQGSTALQKTVSGKMPMMLLLDGSEVGGEKEEAYTFRLRHIDTSTCLVDEIALGLVELEEGADGKSIQEALIKILATYGLKTLHLSGIISDNGSSITGSKTGLFGRLLKEADTEGREPLLLVLDAPHKIQSLVQAPLNKYSDFKFVSETIRKVQTLYRQSGLLRRSMKKKGKNEQAKVYRPCGSWRIRWHAKWSTSFARAKNMRPHWISHLGDDIYNRSKNNKNNKKSGMKNRQALINKLKQTRFVNGLEYFEKCFTIMKKPISATTSWAGR